MKERENLEQESEEAESAAKKREKGQKAEGGEAEKVQAGLIKSILAFAITGQVGFRERSIRQFARISSLLG